jgi:glycosyltransferase involved in cell wall biosynthesis
MEKLLGDETLRDDHREAGIARAALFTWHKAARETADVYRRTLAY